MKYVEKQSVKVYYMGRYRSGKIIAPLPKTPFGEQFYRVEVMVPNFETEIVKISEDCISGVN